MKKAAFYTLGCKVNQYETEAIKETFTARGYEIADFGEYADIYVVNTCTVTNLGDRKSRQIIRRAKKINKNSVLVVCGCYSQSSPKEVLEIEGVNLVMGTQNRNKIAEIAENLNHNDKINMVSSIENAKKFEDIRLTNFENHTRAFLKIQEGCRQFCTYCIIPYVRGNLRSRPENEVLSEAENLAKNGYCEIVLTGIHLASYGIDLKNTNLLSLMQKLNKIEGIKRIRLGSLEPNIISREFVEAISKLEKLCPNFHIALQSGSDGVLKRMNRKYTKDVYKNHINLIRTYFPCCAITTDLMVGFPGETDEEFAETCEFIKEIGFSQIHTFKYSKRKGTPAETYENQVAPEVKEQRSKEIIKIANKCHNDFLVSYLSTTMEVLFEKFSDGMWEGHTKNYVKVKVSSNRNLENVLKNVYITAVESGNLRGEIIDEGQKN